MLSPLTIPDDYNYIGVFLTLECGLHCSYCINSFGGTPHARQTMSGEEWLRGLNRIHPSPNLPVSLQGGEPTLHTDFFKIVNGLRSDIPIDLLTNLEVAVDRFLMEIEPKKLRRDAPYASIRVSYHPEVMGIDELAAKVAKLQDAGFSIGIWGVMHPFWEEEIVRAKDYCTGLGIDFRTKEFLGHYKGAMHGVLSYPDACDRRDRAKVQCRTTELLIGPAGDVYRCHSDLYEDRDPVGHILNPDFTIDTGYRSCDSYGFCNPCDVKLKTNRFQEYGHTAVEIIQ